MPIERLTRQSTRPGIPAVQTATLVARRVIFSLGTRGESMKYVVCAFALMCTLLGVAMPAQADRCTRSLKKVQGYTVVSVTQVDGEFQGCDFGKIIRLMDGTALKCSSYGYTYAYMPDAVVFAKQATYQGKTFVMIKLLVEGELFDMEPTLLK